MLNKLLPIHWNAYLVLVAFSLFIRLFHNFPFRQKRTEEIEKGYEIEANSKFKNFQVNLQRSLILLYCTETKVIFSREKHWLENHWRPRGPRGWVLSGACARFPNLNLS